MDFLKKKKKKAPPSSFVCESYFQHYPEWKRNISIALTAGPEVQQSFWYDQYSAFSAHLLKQS